MYLLGNLTLPLYVCPYTVPAPFSGGYFDQLSNDPVIINNFQSNIAPGSATIYMSIFAPSPFDYGVTTMPNPQFGGPGANGGIGAAINGHFIVVQSGINFGIGGGTGYPYNFYDATYFNSGALEGLFGTSVVNNYYGIFSGFTGAFGNYGLVQQQAFPIPDFLSQNLLLSSNLSYCTITGPGTGFTGAVVLSTFEGNYIAPLGNNICYTQESPAYNFQLGPFRFNRKTMLMINAQSGASSQWYSIDWKYYQLLPQAQNGTPIALGNGAMFAPVKIDDNSTLNQAMNNISVNNIRVMSNDEFFTVILPGISSFAGMASTILMIYPDRGYYVNVHLVPKTSSASNALLNTNYSVQFDRRGWFMFMNPVVSSTAIFNTVPLSVDFTFPPLPKNAINPLPCFNNAIEGLIVG